MNFCCQLNKTNYDFQPLLASAADKPKCSSRVGHMAREEGMKKQTETDSTATEPGAMESQHMSTSTSINNQHFFSAPLYCGSCHPLSELGFDWLRHSQPSLSCKPLLAMPPSPARQSVDTSLSVEFTQQMGVSINGDTPKIDAL